MLSVNFHRVLTRCPCLVNTAIQQSCSLCPIRIFFTLWISLKFSWLKCWSLSGLFSPWLPNQSHRPGSGQPGSNSSSPQDPNCFCAATYAQSAPTPLFIESILRMLGVNRTAGKTMKPCFHTLTPLPWENSVDQQPPASGSDCWQPLMGIQWVVFAKFPTRRPKEQELEIFSQPFPVKGSLRSKTPQITNQVITEIGFLHFDLNFWEPGKDNCRPKDTKRLR